MMSKHGIAGFWLAVALMLGLTACGGEQESDETVAIEKEVTVAKIEGEVFYRERMMLPPGAEVEVQLQDISRADALAAVMETVMFKAEGGPPYAFIIHYDPADIDERGRYSLRATITHGDQLGVKQLLIDSIELLAEDDLVAEHDADDHADHG